MYIIDQAQGLDGWILAEFSFCIFMDKVKVHENVKRELARSILSTRAAIHSAGFGSSELPAHELPKQ